MRLAATVLGLGLVAFGLWLVGAYVLGVISVLGEPDRSWIFWGLGLVAIAVPAFILGVRLLTWGRSPGQGGS